MKNEQQLGSWPVYSIIFLQGIAGNFPWHALTIANSYYSSKLGTLSYAQHFIAHFAIVFITIKFIFLAGSLIAEERVTVEKRTYYSSGLMCIGVGVLFILAFIDDRISVSVFYIVTLSMVGLIAFASAWSEIAIFELLAGMPPMLTQAFLTGHALAGVLVCIQAILLLLFYKTDQEITNSRGFAITYFGITFSVCLVALITFTRLHKIPYFHQQLKNKAAIHDTEAVRLSTFKIDTVNVKPVLETKNGWVQIMSHVWPEAVTSFLVHAENMTIFPALVFLIEPVETSILMFIPLMYFVYNVGDLLAKSLAGLYMPQGIPIFSLSILRLVLIIGYLGTKLKTNNPFFSTPWITSDYPLYMLVFITTFTSGYLNSLGMAYAPQKMSLAMDRAKAAAAVVFTGMLGLVFGAFIGLFLRTYI